MKHEVLLSLGLIADRGLQASFPLRQEFTTGVQMTLDRCAPPPAWPMLVDPTNPAEVMQWLSHVVMWRGAAERPWTSEEHSFFDQLVECMRRSLRTTGPGEPLAKLREVLIAEFFSLIRVCMYPAWERLKREAEDFANRVHYLPLR